MDYTFGLREHHTGTFSQDYFIAKRKLLHAYRRYEEAEKAFLDYEEVSYWESRTFATLATEYYNSRDGLIEAVRNFINKD